LGGVLSAVPGIDASPPTIHGDPNPDQDDPQGQEQLLVVFLCGLFSHSMAGMAFPATIPNKYLSRRVLMASFNRVMIMGNLTRDIELKHTPSNQAVATIGIAVNRTTFIDCDAWGRQAEVMAQYLSKGRPVFIEGRLKLDTWQDQQGNNRSKLKVVVENFQFIGSRDGAKVGSGTADADPKQHNAGGEHHAPVPDDDIPF
jgi:single-strand DNA-binding protein